MPITQHNPTATGHRRSMAAGPRHPGRRPHPSAGQRRPQPAHHLVDDHESRRQLTRDAHRRGQVDGFWYFNSGPGTRKSRNLAADPRCAVSVATHPFDLVIDGTDPQVNDADEVRTVAAAFNDQGWPAEVDGNGLTAEYSAPSAGPPPWHVYRITPVTVFAFSTAEPLRRYPIRGVLMTDDETVIRELITRWTEAVHAEDLNGVLADHDPDIVMFDVPPPYNGIRGIDAYRDSWPPFFEWQRKERFSRSSSSIDSRADVAFAYALLRCGTPAEFEANPENLL